MSPDIDLEDLKFINAGDVPRKMARPIYWGTHLFDKIPAGQAAVLKNVDAKMKARIRYSLYMHRAKGRYLTYWTTTAENRDFIVAHGEEAKA